VLFIGTQFSNLYTAVDAERALGLLAGLQKSWSASFSALASAQSPPPRFEVMMSFICSCRNKKIALRKKKGSFCIIRHFVCIHDVDSLSLLRSCAAPEPGECVLRQILKVRALVYLASPNHFGDEFTALLAAHLSQQRHGSVFLPFS
jgi:hypothetical protein